jgi:chitinase
VTATAVSAAEVDVTWHASTDDVGIAGYHVYRGGSLVTTLEAVTSYTDTGLQDATTYHYTVDAVDAAGNVSDRSVSALATTADATAPTVPNTVTAVVTRPRQVQLSWRASTDTVGVAEYDVYRDASLIAGYRLVAFDAAGNSSAATATQVIAAK